MNDSEGSVRIGPISLFTLIAVLCLATLAVLSITTANASYNMAELHGESITQQYEAEDAAQHFVALLDEQYTGNQFTGSVDAIAQQTQQQSGEHVTVSAQIDGSKVTAQFACENGRTLNIEVTLGAGGTYTIEKWNMTAKQNSAETGTLWSGM